MIDSWPLYKPPIKRTSTHVYWSEGLVDDFAVGKTHLFVTARNVDCVQVERITESCCIVRILHSFTYESPNPLMRGRDWMFNTWLVALGPEIELDDFKEYGEQLLFYLTYRSDLPNAFESWLNVCCKTAMIKLNMTERIIF